MYVKNHGIPEEILNNTFSLLERFFALDQEAKMDAHVQKNPAIRGYEPFLETKLDPRTQGDNKEAFTMGDCVIEPEQNYRGKTGQEPPSHITRPQNIWPSAAPWWRQGLYEYYNHILPLGMNLVRIFALAFGLEEHYFDPIFRFPITGMRALHYPPTPVDKDASSVGLGAHADFSCEDPRHALAWPSASSIKDSQTLNLTYLCSTHPRVDSSPPRFRPGP